jgi:hypothetical protein
MDFDSAFDDIASAMALASRQDGFTLASRAVEKHGLTEQGDGTPSQVTVWEKTEQGRTLRFQWRWYDQSKAFSIQPDMNVLTLELREGGTVIRRAENRYEDAY